MKEVYWRLCGICRLFNWIHKASFSKLSTVIDEVITWTGLLTEWSDLMTTELVQDYKLIIADFYFR